MYEDAVETDAEHPYLDVQHGAVRRSQPVDGLTVGIYRRHGVEGANHSPMSAATMEAAGASGAFVTRVASW